MNERGLFEYMDRFSLGQITDTELQDYIKSHPYDLGLVELNISAYAYAAMISPKCLQILHETYLDLSENTQDKLGKPWDIQSDEIGFSVIHYVVENNLTKCLKYLTTVVNVNVNLQDKRGDTALHIICFRGFIDAAQILLHSANPNINIVNNLGYTPIALCVKYNYYKLASILLKFPVLFEYDWNDMHYNIRNNVIHSGSIEMKSVFQKHFKKRDKNITRKKQDSNDIHRQYSFYCSSFEDSLGSKGAMALARSIGINFKNEDYANLKELKRDLCHKIAKRMVNMHLLKKLD
jgi:ankyrin repeat protein